MTWPLKVFFAVVVALTIVGIVAMSREKPQEQRADTDSLSAMPPKTTYPVTLKITKISNGKPVIDLSEVDTVWHQDSLPPWETKRAEK